MSQITAAPKTEIAASDVLIGNLTACCQSEEFEDESEEESLLPNLSALRAEEDYQQNHDAADLCYTAMLNYRSLRIKEQANGAKQIEKGQNHVKAPDEATLVRSDSDDDDSQEFDSDPNDGLSGQHIARLFADQAGKVLDAAEFKMLLDFLYTPPTIPPLGHLHNAVSVSLQEFHNAEIKESGEPLDRLATPSGPENAPLGLVMHVQTKKGKVGGFWDSENSSIQILEKKGLSSASIYGFDWHWRAEESAHNRGSCPATQWSEELLSLHNNMSFHLLEFLPLPFLIVTGSCAKAGYRRTLSKRSKRIGLTVKSYSVIEVDLDFRSDGLRRISAYMDHPAACFFRPKYALQNALCQDAVLNLFLWLTHQRSSPTAFSDLQRSHDGESRRAPLKEMWQYLQMEREQRRNLEEKEYEQGFLTWAHGFLREDPIGILEQGGSVAGALSNSINERHKAAIANLTSTPEGKSRLARRNRENLQARYKLKYREYWHGAVVNIAKNGAFRIFPFIEQRALGLSLGKHVFQKVQAHGGPTTIEFAKTGIALKVGEHIFQTKSRQMLSRLKDGIAWVKQLDREVERLERQTFASSDDTSQSMTPDNRDSAITQQHTGVSEAVMSGDLRHRLLSNALFHCSEWTHGSKAGRVYFRGVAIYVPKQAEVCKGVRVFCDLSAENVSHSTPCVIDATEEDPARRLGIRVTFFNKNTNVFDSQWYQQKGEQNIRKLNSLVDFLLNKDIAYTQSQSRRYLGKQKKADKNLEVQYTS